MKATQDNRHAALDTVLGKDKVLLKSFHGEETLGRPFDYQAVLLDPEHHVDPDKLIGTNVTLRLQLEDASTRYINGFICQLSYHGMENNAGVYHAQVVPWLWLLTRTSDCRIFQNKTIPKILEEIFSENGFSDYELRLNGAHPSWEQCVQYNETDFNFVSRLMEHEGIYYFFKHDNGKHTMVLVDDMGAHEKHPHAPDVEWKQHTGVLEDGYIYDMTYQKVISPGAYAHNDYNFKKPKDDLRTDEKQEKKHAGSKFEIFEYPGVYDNPGQGREIAKWRIQEAQTHYESISSLATKRALCCGYKFDLKKAERKDQEREYLIVSTTTMIQQDSYASGGGGGGDKFQCHINCIPTTLVYRSPRSTPKPRIPGPQCGLCVGPAGEEIYTDEHGRVKVHFYWDRRSKADAKSSMWIRVSHPSGGKGWGQLSLPRIGQEVLVEFLDGDPDRPIVTGRVYNGENMPPYALPGNKTRSIMKSNSSPGGGGYNELRFEDLKGKEQIFIHGQKDVDVRVKKEWREDIGTNAHYNVGGNMTSNVGGDVHLTVGKSRNEDVAKDVNLSVGKDLAEKVAMNISTEAGMSIHYEAGMNIEIKAGMNITLQAGGSKIALTPAGIFITGPMVFINSGSAGVPVPKISPEKPKKPVAAKDSSAGKVEKSKGMGYASNPQSWRKKTVHDIAAQTGAPLYEQPAPAPAAPPPTPPPVPSSVAKLGQGSGGHQ